MKVVHCYLTYLPASDTCLARLSPDFVMNLAGLPPMRGRDVWRLGVDVCSNTATLHGQLTAGDT